MRASTATENGHGHRHGISEPEPEPEIRTRIRRGSGLRCTQLVESAQCVHPQPPATCHGISVVGFEFILKYPGNFCTLIFWFVSCCKIEIIRIYYEIVFCNSREKLFLSREGKSTGLPETPLSMSKRLDGNLRLLHSWLSEVYGAEAVKSEFATMMEASHRFRSMKNHPEAPAE